MNVSISTNTLVKDKLKELKKKLGAKTYSEVINLLIQYRELQEKS